MSLQVENAIKQVFEQGVSSEAKAVFLEILYTLIQDDLTKMVGFTSYGGWSNDVNPQIRELEQARVFEVRGPDECGRLYVRLSESQNHTDFIGKNT